MMTLLMPRRVLILGGTADANALADQLVHAGGFDVIVSLAGVTRTPNKIDGIDYLEGGFGGAEGLADFLTKSQIDTLVDATHPFAAQISCNAVEASATTGIPMLRIDRPIWMPETHDHWIDVESVSHAADILPAEARLFCAVGRRGLEPLFERKDLHIHARMVEPFDHQIENLHVIIQRPPYTAEADEALFRAREITALVCKNAGGAVSKGKLIAARRLEIPVYMIKRPDVPPALNVGSVEAAVIYLTS